MRAPPPRATVWLVAGTCGVHLVLASLRLVDHAALLAGFVPLRVGPTQWYAEALPVWITPLTATLIHANLLHLAFNMLMLGFCGKMVEAALGQRGVLALYVLGGYAAAAAQWAAGPMDATPMVGASGAVSAMVGAYALLYGQRRLKDWGPISGRLLNILWLAAAWIGLQLLIGIAGIGIDGTGAIAVAAHIGGFLAGLALAGPLLRWRYRKA